MAKIGSRILETRLKKGLTLDRIADDTNISVRFLSKIENDDFTGFPGEPYVVGFIRNYADYLGLKAEDIVALYRSKDEDVLPSTREQIAEKESLPPASPVVESVKNVNETAPVDMEGKDKEVTSPPPKTKKTRKKPASVAPDTMPLPSDVEPPKPAIQKEVAAEIPAPVAATHKRLQIPARRAGIAGVFAIIIVGAAIVWIFAGGKSSSVNSNNQAKQTMEYRVEGTPFEKRLYVGDSLLVPLENDVYKIRLASITETVNLETPFGPFKLSLGEAGTIDPDKNGAADASIIVGDFEKNREASGVLLRVEYAPIEAGAQVQGEITIPGNTTSSQSPSPVADTVILKSSRGPYPFVVQVTFRGNCLFRYEADRKEWVEKYYSKGESITVNVSSALTVWASNAQAAKLSFQATGGKTADLEIGAPGEIAVKKIGWSKAEGTWALVSSNLD